MDAGPSASDKLASLHGVAARRLLWAAPALLSLLFVAGVVVWARDWAQERDTVIRHKSHNLMLASADSLRAQLEKRYELESAKLRLLASKLPAGANLSREQLEAGARLLELESARLNREQGNASAPGSRRFGGLWLQVTWSLANSRRAAQVPAVPDDYPSSGRRMFLASPVGDQAGTCAGGKLVVLYAPVDLLNDEAARWLKGRYRVELVAADEVVADNVQRGVEAGETLSVEFTPPPDPDCGDILTPEAQQLRLTDLQPPPPVFRDWPLAAAGVGIFVAMITCAALALRRQTIQTSFAEEKWRDEAARRASMEDSALVGLRARDMTGRVMHVNRTFCELVGYRADELAGRVPPMPYWSPETIEESMQQSERNLQGGAPREGYETRWLRRDGAHVDVVLFESPLVDARGKQTGWMGSVVDITKRKALEEVERRQAELLAHHARLSAVGELASTLAHDLNQPLGTISNYSAGLKSALSKQGDSSLIEVATAIERHAQRASAIVSRVRKRVVKGEASREPCSLNELVREAAELLRRELERTRVELALELERDLPEPWVDRVRIEQVVTNLLRNAIDALAAREVDGRVTVATRREFDGTSRQLLWVSVRDNGPGLAGRELSTLIEPFYSSKPDGMGLGLAICRSILDEHDGMFTAEELAEGGACFSFGLPIGTSTLESANEHAEDSLRM